MKIAHKYSHLNGEEYLMVHHRSLYEEITSVITHIDAEAHKTKVSGEATMMGTTLYAPKSLNKAFKEGLKAYHWEENRYDYYVTLNRELMEQSVPMSAKDQKIFLETNGETNHFYSFNQTDFVKDKIAVEVQLAKYTYVAYDLFIKHMMYYTGNVIDVGIEIIPTKAMNAEMSTGVPCYEKGIYNLMRQGRSSPAVPLLILGIEPD